jgi:hypothetical protein
VFFGFGLNGLLHLIPLPPAEGTAAMFINGLIASRYFFPLLFVTYLLTGAGLLIGRFVPLALTVLAPIIVNIAVMHFFLPASGAEICLAVLVTALELFLAGPTAPRSGGLLHASDELERMTGAPPGVPGDAKAA